ncbi:UDP-N-acetylmuramate--L-alanine ligase [Cellulomonas sp. T2.31MG-18]|uniref:UDP-N-acetylmuramate--L-alanine ligase n=1 Tax=Cellulomonas sp. T2.31MG-18 TaxID=3157619 RepID=UPI0035EA07B6
MADDPGSVLLAGGGTAGHVNPLLAVADALRAARPGIRITVLGTREGLESDLVPAYGLPLAIVPRVPLPRRPSGALLHLPARLRAAVGAATSALEDAGAQVVVGFGGYVSTPAYLAARHRGLPVVVHEQNARPGLANRLGARWARAVAVTFPGTVLPHAQVTGLPLRPAVAALLDERATDPAAARRRAADELGLDPDLPTLLVTGGSLGALSINRAVSAAASDLLGSGVQVLHLTGRGKADPVRRATEDLPGAEHYHVLEYLSRMELALAVADLVVGRAGAGTVCELAALGIPAVYVPLPVGNGEQRLNAASVVAAGGGLLVDDTALDASWLRAHVLPLLVGPGAVRQREQMARAAASVGVRDAAQRVAQLVLDQLPPVARPTSPPASPEPGATGREERGDDVPSVDSLGRVHLIGVGGAGMSAVAALLAARGLDVSGSDAQDGPALPGLREAGVRVHVGHDASAVRDVDTVVISSAVRETNPELAAARAAGLRVLHRSQALAALMAGRDSVAVAGAHGKTTTSAMVATALLHAGVDPSFAIGGTVLTVPGPVGGGRHGDGPFVAEADESDGSFLAYRPLVSVVTNVEPDHLDHYGTREAFEAAFAAFADRIRPGGQLVACLDDPGAARLVRTVTDRLVARGVEVVTYGRSAGSDVHVGPTRATAQGWETELAAGAERVVVRLAVPGAHNGLNAAAAWAVLRRLGLDATAAAEALGAFRGTGRRFEGRGTAGGVRVVDDYAHHPTEIAALLGAARQVAGDGRVLVLFQPHLYSRTRTFADEFAHALELADAVVVTDVYAAREDPEPGVTGALITDRMTTPGRGRFVAGRTEAASAVAALARPGDLVLTVGAGDVTQLAPVVLAALDARLGAGRADQGGAGPA